MFNITDRKGFQMTFANGWTVSVQFSYGNYCDNQSYGSFGADVPPCPNAEIAAWDKDDNWYKFVNDDQVDGWKTPDEVAAFITMIAAK